MGGTAIIFFSKTKDTTVGYYFAKVMETKIIKEQTIAQYHQQYNAYLKPFEDISVEKIDRKFIKEWIERHNEVAYNSFRWRFSVFMQIMEKALEDDVIEVNPFKGIRLKKTKVKPPDPYSREEIDLLLSYTTDYYRNFLAFLFCTGMRVGECLALNWEDIRYDRVLVYKNIYFGTITTTKNNKVRTIPIFDELRPFIADQREYMKDGDRIFYQLNSAGSARNRWYKILKGTGVKKRALYQARHTFAANALRGGMSPSDLCCILGNNLQTFYKFYIGELTLGNVDVKMRLL